MYYDFFYSCVVVSSALNSNIPANTKLKSCGKVLIKTVVHCVCFIFVKLMEPVRKVVDIHVSGIMESCQYQSYNVNLWLQRFLNWFLNMTAAAKNTCKLICFKLHFTDRKRIYLFSIIFFFFSLCSKGICVVFISWLWLGKMDFILIGLLSTIYRLC